MAIGPMIGFWVAQDVSYPALFLVAVGLPVSALLLTFGAHLPFRRSDNAAGIVLFEP